MKDGLCVGGAFDGRYKTYSRDTFKVDIWPESYPTMAYDSPITTIEIETHTYKKRHFKDGRTQWYEWHYKV